MKPAAAFYRRTARARGYSSECKDCHKRAVRYRDSDARRDRTLQRRYGITAEEYDALLSAQGGRCAMCKRPHRGRGRLAVDHDHATGRVRGLLCFHCNTMLGHVEAVGLGVVAAYLALERTVA